MDKNVSGINREARFIRFIKKIIYGYKGNPYAALFLKSDRFVKAE